MKLRKTTRITEVLRDSDNRGAGEGVAGRDRVVDVDLDKSVSMIAVIGESKTHGDPRVRSLVSTRERDTSRVVGTTTSEVNLDTRPERIIISLVIKPRVVKL